MSDSPAEPKLCATCGGFLEPESLEGLCLSCLVRLGAEDLTETGGPLAKQGYELLEEIGAGGAGVVYRARQIALDRIVAVKVLRNAPWLDRLDLERFQREARSIGQMSHSNIVAVHEVGEVDGQPWFSMQYVAGADLAKLVNQGPLEPRRAARLVRKIATAVEHAHTKGVLHRDLKPSNVMVDDDDEPHVTDFGLAYCLNDEAQDVRRDRAGTASYMAPEQVQPGLHPLSPRTDVWALGAMLFHLLTGRPPFLGSSWEDTTQQVANAIPLNPRQLNPSIPVDLATICRECLQKDPAARYPRAREVADELRRFEAGLPIKARPETGVERAWRFTRRHPIPVMLGVALVVATLGWLGAAESGRRSAVAAATAAKAGRERAHQALIRQLVERGFAALSEGNSMGSLPWLVAAWTSDTGPTTSAHAMRFHSALNQTPRLEALWPIPGGATVVAASSEGETAAAAGFDGTVVVWNTRTGELVGRWKESMPVSELQFDRHGRVLYVALAPDVPAQQPQGTSRILARLPHTGEVPGSLEVQGKIGSIDLSPDDALLVTANTEGKVEVWSAASMQRLATADFHRGLAHALFAPGTTNRIATCAYDHTARLWDWQENTSRVLPHGGYVRNLAWAPDGQSVATACDDGFARLWDARTGQILGRPMGHQSRVYAVAFSPDGSLVATASSDSTSRLWDARTGAPRSSPFAGTQRTTHIAFSPDGRLLLTATSEGLVHVWDPRSASKVASIMQTGNISGVAWLPDSQGIVTAGHEGLARQWSLRVGNGWEAELRLAQSPNAIALDPKRSQLLVGMDDGGATLWRWEPDARTLNLQHTGDVLSVGFEASGTRCYTITRAGGVRLWDAETGAPRHAFPEHGRRLRASAISPEGTELMVGDSAGTVRLLNLTTYAEAELYRAPGSIRHVGYAPGGRYLGATVSLGGAHYPTENRWRCHVWRRPDLVEQCVSDPLPGEAQALTFNHSATHVAVTTTLARTYVLDVATGKTRWVLEQPGEVRSVDFSTDNHFIVTGGAQGVIRLWRADTGELVTSSLSLSGAAGARFDRAGQRILTFGRDSRSQLWDVATMLPLLPPFRHDDAIFDAAFAADGDCVATAGNDLRIRLWNLEIPTRNIVESARTAKLVSGHVVDASGTLVPVPAEELAALWVEERARRR